MKRLWRTLLIALLSTAAASSSDVTPPNEPATNQSAGAAVTSKDLLNSFSTFCVKSHTIYLHEALMQETLQERPEFAAWSLKASTSDAADVIIEIRLPFLTWEWNYNVIQRTTGAVLSSGKVKALEEHQAAPLLASEI